MDKPCSRWTRTLGAAAAAVLLLAPSLAAQTGTVTGRVTDSQSGAPISSVQIFIEGSSLGALTQQNGRFLLVNVPAGTHTVTASRIGYRTVTQEVTVGAGATVVQDFVLSEEALQLQEVIVTGTAGGQQRRALGNSVEVLSAAAVTEQAPITSMQSLMAARTPGLRFNNTTGDVGGGAGITVRGIGSTLLGNQPLVYVDGVRVNSDATTGPNTGGSQNASALNDLNPEDIESIEVIKGPSAATLYGTEASAGVIQIITKRGSVGAPEFQLEATAGSNFMIHPAEKIGTQYTCQVLASQCPVDQVFEYNMYDEGNDYLRRQGRYAGLEPTTPNFNVNSHYVGEGRDSDLFNNGPTQRYNGSVRGGVDQVRYYAGASWLDETGIIDYNTNDQLSARSNVTVLFGEDVNVDLSVGYSQGKTRFGTVDEEGGLWTLIAGALGTSLPGVRADNPLTPTSDESLGNGFLGFYQNFPEHFEETDISREYSRFTASVTASHNYSGWLSQRLTLGLDKSAATDTEFLPGNRDFANAPAGYLAYGRPNDENITFDYSASAAYDVTSSFRATTSAGLQYYVRRSEDITATGQGFPTDVQRVIDQTEFGNRQLDFSSVENKTAGFYVQEEFSWQDRIFVTGAVRADDNSAFGSDFDLQYYPKISGSWVVSEEAFWSSLDFVNSLRLRGAWGRSGRQPSTFAAQTLYTTFLGHDGNGLIPATAGNPGIGPEVSEELELGFDLALFDDRIAGEFSYYSTTTNDMLVNQSLAPSTGLTGSRQANLGSMDIWGFETSLDARILRMDNVAFDLNVAVDYTNNEIKSLGQDVLPGGNFQIGWPFPNVASDFLIRDAQMNAAGTSLDVTSVTCDGGTNGGITRPDGTPGPNIFPGGPTIPCSSYTDDGLLLGTAYPKYTFRVGPTLTLFEDLQIFALAEGQYGRWVAQVETQYSCGFFRNCYESIVRDNPVWLAGRLFGPVPDDRFQGRYPADFWRLRQVGFRYNLPADIVGRIGADRAAFSFAANNVWLLWMRTKDDWANHSIYDPEYINNGGGTPNQISLWETPPIASISASLRVTF